MRDPVKTRAEGHLTGLSGADERLELTAADLLTQGAFDDAVRDCEYVIHTASPYAIDVADPQRDLVDPAVRGTISVLESCRETDSMRRVVLTSSVAAITDHADGHLNTESDWNTRSSLTRNPYYYSKTLAEQAAWQFVEAGKPRFDLVVINPFFVIGPSLVPGINTSHTSLIGLTNGQHPGGDSPGMGLGGCAGRGPGPHPRHGESGRRWEIHRRCRNPDRPSGRRPPSIGRLGRPLQAADASVSTTRLVSLSHALPPVSRHRGPGTT